MHEKTQRLLEAKRLVQEYCLMDDSYMTAFFKDNIESVELVLKILLQKDDLKVKRVVVQDVLKNLRGHSATMDVVAVDSFDKVYNIEVQNAVTEAHPKRARYYSSLLDSNLLPKGENYENLPDTYVIFITKDDRFGEKEMLYHFERKSKKKSLNDGSHIIYVNAENRDDSAIGKLMHDFLCTNPNEMCYDNLREKSLEIKGDAKGDTPMDRITERIVELHMENVAEDLLQDTDLSVEAIAKSVKLPLERVQAIADDLGKQ